MPRSASAEVSTARQAPRPAAVTNRNASSISTTVCRTAPPPNCRPVPRARPWNADATAASRSASSSVSDSERLSSSPSADSTMARSSPGTRSTRSSSSQRRSVVACVTMSQSCPVTSGVRRSSARPPAVPRWKADIRERACWAAASSSTVNVSTRPGRRRRSRPPAVVPQLGRDVGLPLAGRAGRAGRAAGRAAGGRPPLAGGAGRGRRGLEAGVGAGGRPDRPTRRRPPAAPRSTGGLGAAAGPLRAVPGPRPRAVPVAGCAVAVAGAVRALPSARGAGGRCPLPAGRDVGGRRRGPARPAVRGDLVGDVGEQRHRDQRDRPHAAVGRLDQGDVDAVPAGQPADHEQPEPPVLRLGARPDVASRCAASR